MSKRKKGWLDDAKPEGDPEALKHLEQLLPVEEVVEEVMVEPEPEPKPVVEVKVQNGSKAVVTSNRAWVFTEADVFSKPTGGVVKGNLLNILEGPIQSGKVIFYKVEVRRPHNASFTGFVLSTKLKVV